MASVLTFLLSILCKVPYKLRGFIPRCLNFKSWALLLAFLGRKLGLWRPWKNGENTFRRSEQEQAEHSFPGTGALAGAGEVRVDVSRYHPAIVACSSIPSSARHPSQPDQTSPPPPPPPPPPGPANLTAKPQHEHPQAFTLSVFGAGIHSNRSWSSLSVHSRASDRLSILQSHSYESLHSPLGQQKGSPKAAHRQFGCGPSTDNLEASAHPNAIDVHGHHLAPSSASVVVEIENPSTESLPRSQSADSPTPQEEPYSIGSPTLYSSPSSKPSNLPEESLHPTPTASLVSDFELPEGRFLQMIISEQVPRYTKLVTVPRERKYYEIEPLTTKFPHVPTHPEPGSLEADCDPWIAATHPDGALYFFDEDRRLFTDTDMHNSVLKVEMEEFYECIQKIKRHGAFEIPSNDYDLVLDIMPTDDGRMQWSYYYACHETRCLFWLHLYDANHMISEVFWVTSPAHVKHRLEALYWTHWSLFPVVFNGRCLQPAVYDELIGILSHGCMDVMTSKSSTLPYDEDTMQKMIKLVRKAKESDAGVEYHTASVTRLLSFFAHWKFLYVHGQQHARLIRNQTVYSGPKRPRSLLITLLSLVLFLAPEVHLKEVERLWTDEIIIETVWKSFMSKLLGEWEELILWSTVMLTANVGFLAIPGVVISNINSNELLSASMLKIFMSTSQIASSISILASVGSTVIGLLLIRHNRSKQKEDPAGAARYLFLSTHPKFGLEPLAIIFSLPWALLMWAMVMFSIALLLFSFYYSNTSTRVFVTVASALLSVLTLWCIGRAWESSDGREVWFSNLVPSITHALSNARDQARDKRRNILAVMSRWGHLSSHTQEHGNSAHSTHNHEEGEVV